MRMLLAAFSTTAILAAPAAAQSVDRAMINRIISMGAITVSFRPTGGTDHVYMQTVGIPGYQFIQDPLGYGSRIHHTSIDSYEHLKAEDMRPAAINMASVLLNAANRDQALPRTPLPTQPRPSDPFEYVDPDGGN
jgi:hypothetical protein